MPDNQNKFADISILDNRRRGSVGEYLADKIKPDERLSFVSAYFMIYAYRKLKAQIDDAGHLRFLFGEPSFIKSLGGENQNRRNADILDEAVTIPIPERLFQKSAAQECAEWIRGKAEIRSMVKPN